MKLEPHIPQLPSIGELLEHPRVKGLVARVNRSTLAQRAAGFLEELRGSLAARTASADPPSLTLLAERLARRLLGEPPARGPLVNATGLVLGHPDLAPPLAERCLQAMFHVAAEYHRRDAAAGPLVPHPLCQTLGGEAAYAATSFESALTLAVAATATGREILVFDGGAPDGPIDWTRLAARSGAVVRRAPTAAAMRGAAALVRTPEADGDAPLPALAAAAREQKAFLIDAAPAAGVVDPASFGLAGTATIAQRIAEGADLVVVDAAGLVAGPTCGLIVGKSEYVDLIANHPLASFASADRLTRTALDATVQAYRDDGEAAFNFQLPLWQLLSTPLANLEQRARRLAPQMAESEWVASAEARPIESAWRRWGDRQWTAASWAVALRPARDDCGELMAHVERGPYPLLAREADGAVLLDLRAVFPRWDQQLVAAVVGSGRDGSD